MSIMPAMFEAMVDQRLGDMTPYLFCKQLNRYFDTCSSIGLHRDGVPYTMSLKSASVEVFNWNLLNEIAFVVQRKRFALVVGMEVTLLILCWSYVLGARR